MSGDIEALRDHWAANGWCRWPGFLSAEQVVRYRHLCDRVLDQWVAEQGGWSAVGRTSNMAYLTEPRYYTGRADELTALLSLIADPRILSLLEAIAGEPPLFHNTQYFMETPGEPWRGMWHRDTQFLAEDPALERARMASATGVHFRIAFQPDACLAYVPGSEARWDTPDEIAIRRAADPVARCRNDMPGGRTLALEVGDALLFHAWGIHRGTYRPRPPRRTLDIIYMWGEPCDYAPSPPTCFADRGALADLTPAARAFFERFIETYEPFWRSPGGA